MARPIHQNRLNWYCFFFIFGFSCCTVAWVQYRFYNAYLCSCLFPHPLQLQKFSISPFFAFLQVLALNRVLPTISLDHRDICWPGEAWCILFVPSPYDRSSILLSGLQQQVLDEFFVCLFFKKRLFLANQKTQVKDLFACLLFPVTPLRLETSRSKGVDWSSLKQRKWTYCEIHKNNILHCDKFWKSLELAFILL